MSQVVEPTCNQVGSPRRVISRITSYHPSIQVPQPVSRTSTKDLFIDIIIDLKIAMQIISYDTSMYYNLMTVMTCMKRHLDTGRMVVKHGEDIAIRKVLEQLRTVNVPYSCHSELAWNNCSRSQVCAIERAVVNLDRYLERFVLRDCHVDDNNAAYIASLV